ncbi:hypothetical protein [Natronorubrum sp. DTA7]|uniref:hypothetical protein n=1 Tax=Natronorubrum sp. DTA7 TaxID=3447016 RepID=UPI003F8792E6
MGPIRSFATADTFHDWIPIGGKVCVLRPWSKEDPQVIKAARSDAIGDASTTAEIAAHPVVEISERLAHTHQNRFL